MPKNPLIILTRQHADNEALRLLLAAEGAEVIEYPCIQTEPIPVDQWQSTGALPPEECQAVVFTSRHGVRAFAPLLERLGRAAKTVAVVGSGTAAEVELSFGRPPDLVASPPTADGLAVRLLEILRPGMGILWVRGNRSTETFKDRMIAHGFRLAELVVYRNLPVRLAPLPISPPALLVFGSPSAAENFFECNGSEWKRCLCLAIGPTTAESLVGLGCSRIEKAREPAPEALADRIRTLLKEVNGLWDAK